MSRADALARLAVAYGMHLARRRVQRTRPQLQPLVETYARDGIRPLTSRERDMQPRLTGCINCGLCALAAGRIGRTRLPDLASSYMRLYTGLGMAAGDVAGDGTDLAAAAAVCPVGVPLEEVAEVVRRLANG